MGARNTDLKPCGKLGVGGRDLGSLKGCRVSVSRYSNKKRARDRNPDSKGI